MIDAEFNKRFLTNTDDTGRFIVKSIKTGRTYYVEPIDNNDKLSWGDYNPVTKKFETSLYGQKHKGSVKEEDSLITEENGFDKIHALRPGESPLDYINRIDKEYERL